MTIPNVATSGIPYGVISTRNLSFDLVDTLMYSADTCCADVSYLEAAKEILLNAISDLDLDESPEFEPQIEFGIKEEIENLANHVSYLQDWYEDRVDDPSEVLNVIESIEIDEPIYLGIHEGVSYKIAWLGGATILIVLDSPTIAKAAPCSPCVPNAGDLDNEGSYECYGVPEDWKVGEEE